MTATSHDRIQRLRRRIARTVPAEPRQVLAVRTEKMATIYRGETA
jgi:hypothetical protein